MLHSSSFLVFWVRSALKFSAICKYSINKCLQQTRGEKLHQYKDSIKTANDLETGHAKTKVLMGTHLILVAEHE